MVAYLEYAFAAFLVAFAGFQLWSAATRGRILTRSGGWAGRADAPFSFWMNFAINVIVAVIPLMIVAMLTGRLIFPPSFAQRVASFYPPAAARQRIDGHAVVSCTVMTNYRLRDCEIVQASPAGYQFGEAALKVAAIMTLPERDRPRASPGQKINLPIRFVLPAPDRWRRGGDRGLLKGESY